MLGVIGGLATGILYWIEHLPGPPQAKIVWRRDTGGALLGEVTNLTGQNWQGVKVGAKVVEPVIRDGFYRGQREDVVSTDVCHPAPPDHSWRKQKDLERAMSGKPLGPLGPGFTESSGPDPPDCMIRPGETVAFRLRGATQANIQDVVLFRHEGGEIVDIPFTSEIQPYSER